MTEERRQQEDRRHSTRGGRRRADKVACPKCGSLQSAVVARHMNMQEQLTDGYWRRRMCGSCGTIFATVETVAIEGNYILDSLDR